MRAMNHCPRPEHGRAAYRALGIGTLVLFFVAAIGGIAAFTFAVTVDGHSMDPTLRTGDRLTANFWSRDDVERFDLVEATEPGKSTRLVKRVIAIPGDTLWVDVADGGPRVHIIPAGDTTAHIVRNPTWTSQIGSSLTVCCDDNGGASQSPHRVTVPAGQYWLIGDNWGGSTDSRAFGFVGSDEIKATLNFRLLPLSRFGTVPRPAGLALQPQD